MGNWYKSTITMFVVLIVGCTSVPVVPTHVSFAEGMIYQGSEEEAVLTDEIHDDAQNAVSEHVGIDPEEETFSPENPTQRQHSPATLEFFGIAAIVIVTFIITGLAVTDGSWTGL